MHKSGVNVNLSQLKSHILQVREVHSNPEISSSGVKPNLEGVFVDVGCNSPLHEHPVEPKITAQTKPHNWASLFKAQAPSKSMRLQHFPELQKGKAAVIDLEDSDVDTNSWDNCLLGYFLDGKMPYNLLCATARSVWKENAPMSIKQIGTCYFFEFRDEACKLQVLEGGPYFFSRRYLVLTDWRRMLVPTTEHPPTIPAWVKLHKLPLECWTESSFSRIASSIGKPIHVDEATAGRKRLDFARVCVEISAKDELPEEIVVRANGETAAIRVEYQWLPPKCPECKVFGHKCRPKEVPVQRREEWQVIGRAAALNKGGISALEAVTKFVPITNDTSLGVIKSDAPLSDNDSEDLDEEFMADDPPPVTSEPVTAMSKEGSRTPQPPNSDEVDSTWVDDPGLNKVVGTNQENGKWAESSQSFKPSNSSKKNRTNKKYTHGSNQGGKKTTPLQKR